jgi:hypothetical protein
MVDDEVDEGGSASSAGEENEGREVRVDRRKCAKKAENPR